MTNKSYLDKLKKAGYKFSILCTIRNRTAYQDCIFCGSADDTGFIGFRIYEDEKQAIGYLICNVCLAEVKLAAKDETSFWNTIDQKLDERRAGLHLKASELLGEE